jgi:hypothetical protein
VLQKIAHLQGQFAGELRIRGLQALPLQSICTVIGGLGTAYLPFPKLLNCAAACARLTDELTP